MKKVSLLFMVAPVVTVCVWSASRHKEVSDDLLLANIEALAGNESVHGSCFGCGNVTCFDGTKVAYTFEMFSLK